MGQRMKPIHRENVVDKVTKRIMDAILEGKFKAGEKLPNEYELIEELQVSRNSLREAMKILSAMGIVDICIGDGTYICSEIRPSVIDPVIYGLICNVKSYNGLLECRQAIDESILMQAMRKITPEEIAALRENIEQTGQAIRKGDFDLLEELDLKFHYMLIDSCKNPYYIRLMRGIYGVFEHYIIGAISEDRNTGGAHSQVARYHENMLRCVEEKDIMGIEEAVRLSLSDIRRQSDEE